MSNTTNFTPDQIADLAGSGITPAIAAAAGWYSLSDRTRIESLLGWHKKDHDYGPTLIIPYLDLAGNPTKYHRLKPANPRTEIRKNGTTRLIKYEAALNSGSRVFFPPRTREAVTTPGRSFAITEGEKKGLYASDVLGIPCIALSGVESWRKSGEMIPDMVAIEWRGRLVSIIFDADAATNERVLSAELELAKALMSLGAIIKIVRLPGPEKGLDDFSLARGKSALMDLIDKTETISCIGSCGDTSDLFGTPPTDGSGGGGADATDTRTDEERERDRARIRDYQLKMQADRKAEKEADDPKPLAIICVQARKRFELFRAQNGLAYASEDKVTAFQVEGKRFSDQLYLIHRQFISHSEPAGAGTVANAVAALAAEARLNGMRPVLQRSGWHDGKAYIYRADPTAPSEVLVISSDGVSVTTEPPMRFAIRSDAGPIPRPAVVGDINCLRPFLNLENPDQFPIAAAWIAAVVASSFPVRLLMISGEQGTAKSTFAELILRLVDPTVNTESDMPEEPLRGVPKDEETLAIAALHSHLLAFDNLSGLSNDMSDLFCRVVTGGMFSTRTKYTTTDETRVYLRRPVVFTGIDLPSFRSDLLERMLTVPLKRIDKVKRETKRRLFERFDAARPTILAGLYQLIIRGMNSGISLGGMSLSRMADFDEFAARAIGRETVEQEMANVDHDNATEALQSHPFVPVLLKLMEYRTQWRVTAAELLDELETQFRGDHQNRPFPKRWPGGPHILSGQLIKAAPALSAIHNLRVSKDKDKDSKRTRYLLIERTSSANEASAKRPEEESERRSQASEDRQTLVDDLFI